MKISQHKIAEWFLRLSLSAGFLSAVADRFGLWSKSVSAWGNWNNFLAYTKTLIPFASGSLLQIAGGIATALEITFGLALLIPFKTAFFAKCSSVLLLLFALSMTLSTSIKAPLDASVFTASAAAFALSLIVKLNTSKR